MISTIVGESARQWMGMVKQVSHCLWVQYLWPKWHHLYQMYNQHNALLTAVTNLKKGKHRCHTKVSTKHSLNKI